MVISIGNQRRRWVACALALATTLTGNAVVRAQVLPEVPQEYWKYRLTKGCKSFEKPPSGVSRGASLPVDLCIVNKVTYDNTVSLTVLVFSRSKALTKLKMWVDVPPELRVIQSDIPQFFSPTPGTFHRFQLVIQGEAPNLTGFIVYAEDKSPYVGNGILRTAAPIYVMTQNGYLKIIPATQAAEIRERNRRNSLPKTGESGFGPPASDPPPQSLVTPQAATTIAGDVQ
jgi:hypothetical protein